MKVIEHEIVFEDEDIFAMLQPFFPALEDALQKIRERGYPYRLVKIHLPLEDITIMDCPLKTWSGET